MQGTSEQQQLSDPSFVGTVFIPLNATLLPPNLSRLARQNVISYHIVPGKALGNSQLSNGQVLGTLLTDENITVRASPLEI